MRKMRVLALVLSFSMLITAVPQVAFAAEIESVSENDSEILVETAVDADAVVIDDAKIGETDSEESVEEIIEEESEPSLGSAEVTYFTVDENGVPSIKSGVVLPSTIEASMLAGAKTIPARLFEGKSIKSIEIPETVTSIGANAFANCRSLESVVFVGTPAVTSIGNEAFKQCGSLNGGGGDNYFTIPASVKTIGDRCFEDCKALYAVTFVENSALTTVGDAVFSGCTTLRKLINFDKTKVTTITSKFFDGTLVGNELVLPTTVTKICGNAFTNCSKIGELDLSNLNGASLTLEPCCFTESGLTGIKLPKTYTVVTDSVFDGCNSLETLTLGNVDGTGVTTLNAGAIKNCKNLKTIVLNRSVNRVENYAIQACASLTKIKIYHDEEASGDKITLPFDALPSYRGLVICGYDSAVEEWAGNHNEDGVVFETLHTSLSVEFNKDANTNGNKTEASMTTGINVGNTITVKDTPATGYTLISLTHGVKPTGFVGNSKSFNVSTADLNTNNKIAINASYALLNDLANDDSQFSFVDADLKEFKKENNNTQKLTFESSSLKKQVYIKYKGVYSNPWLWTFTSSNPNVVDISKTGIITTKAATDETITITASLNGRKVCYLKVDVASTRTFHHIGALTIDANSNYDTSKTENGMPLVETSVGYVLTETSKGNTRNFDVTAAAFADAAETQPINTSFTWTSSNKAAVKLVYDKTTSNSNTVKICGVGSAVVTVASTIDPSQKKSFIVRVVDKTPVVEDSSIFINTKAGSTTFTLIQSYGGTVSNDSYLKIFEKAGSEWKDRSNDFKIVKSGAPKDRADGGKEQLMELSVKSTSDYAKESDKAIAITNLYAKLLIDDEKYYYVALPKVTIVSKKPAPSAKVSGKINTFFTSASSIKNEALITLTSPAGYEIETMPEFVCAEGDTDGFTSNFKLSLPADAKAGDYSKLVVTQKVVNLKKDAANKVITKGYLSIKYKGYDAVKLAVTIPTSYVKPAYSMSKSVGSAHKLASGQEFDFQIMEVVNKKKTPISLASVTQPVYAFDSSSYFDGKKPTKVSKADGDYIRIKIDEDLPTDLKNITARVILSSPEWAEDLPFSFKINLVNSNPAMKLGDKLIAINTATTSTNYMTFECVSEFCDNASLSVGAFTPVINASNKKFSADASKINVSFAGGKISATVNPGDLPRNFNGYLFKAPYTINYYGTSNTFSGYVTVKVQIYKTVPNVALKASAVTLNNDLVGYEVTPGTAAEVACVKYSFANMPKTASDNVVFSKITNITNPKNMTEYTTPSAAPVKFEFADGVMKVSLKSTLSGNQKYLLSGVTIDGIEAKDIVFTVKTINKRPTITLTTKSSINVLDTSSSIEYVVKVANFAGTIDASKLAIISEDSDASKNAHFIDVSESASHFAFTEANGDKVKLKINESKRSSLVARAYRIKVNYSFGTKLVGGTPVTKTSESRMVTTKPAQTLPAAKLDTNTITLYGSDTAVGASVVVTPVEKKGVVTPSIASIGWAPNTKADIKDAFCDPATKSGDVYTYFNPTTGKLTVKIKNPALVQKGKTYTLTYMAYYKNQLGGSNGVPVTVKVVIK